MEKKPVLVNLTPAVLKKCSFEYFDSVPNKEYKITLVDSVEAFDFKEKSFILRYERKTVNTEPFSASVVFDLSIQIKDIKDLEENEETIQQFAERKKIDIVNRTGAPSFASLLISNLTRDAGGPYVSIPVFIKLDKETNR